MRLSVRSGAPPLTLLLPRACAGTGCQKGDANCIHWSYYSNKFCLGSPQGSDHLLANVSCYNANSWSCSSGGLLVHTHENLSGNCTVDSYRGEVYVPYYVCTMLPHPINGKTVFTSIVPVACS